MNPELLKLAHQKDGVRCPCCDKFVKVYKRKFNTGMAYVLIQIYRKAKKTDNEWLHVGHFLRKECDLWPSDYSKCVWWGLLEKHPGESDDGNSNGLYRMTRKGSQFVKGRITIPEYAIEYMSKVEKFDGPEIDIRQALWTKDNKFDYNELMRTPAC